MLDIIYAAEMQFRLDSAQLARELKDLAAIRERSASGHEPARGILEPSVRAARTWPRPIGVAHPQPACT